MTEPRKPTEKEAFFFLTILDCMKGAPDVDWELVARKAGYSNGTCARTRYGQIKRAIGWTDDGSSSLNTPIKSRAKRPATQQSTPTKSAKKPKAGKKVVDVEEDDDDDEDDNFKVEKTKSAIKVEDGGSDSGTLKGDAVEEEDNNATFRQRSMKVEDLEEFVNEGESFEFGGIYY